ncbi:hypothetical protein BLNAU_14642 [Blattamonas nauphoetae]|uniref:non-specific serine/threonine protein kinase n=1 Tax=Blattamonas nauphoetae TaxID=2049346 RepID=A0ABQ9XEL1_9EUKA|nr:hypothetical protein BLNAU_14642 [Blattamonas nauphoetae]
MMKLSFILADYKLRKKIELQENSSLQNNKIGVIDTKEVCGSCAQTFCGNCIGQFGFQLLQRPQPCVYNKNSIRLCKECFMKFSIYIRHRDSAVQIRNHDHNIIEKTWNSLLMEENKVLELIRPHTSMVLPPSNIPAVFPNSTPPPSSPSNPNPISPQSLQQAQAAFQGFTALLVAVKKRHEERKGEFDRAFEAMKAQRKEPAEMGERDLWIMGKLIDLFITRRDRTHCIIRFQENAAQGPTVTLENKSKNGTYLNQSKVSVGSPTNLNDKDLISLKNPSKKHDVPNPQFQLECEIIRKKSEPGGAEAGFLQKYQYISQLGYGTFATVNLVTTLDEKIFYALKHIDKKCFRNRQIQQGQWNKKEKKKRPSRKEYKEEKEKARTEKLASDSHFLREYWMNRIATRKIPGVEQHNSRIMESVDALDGEDTVYIVMEYLAGTDLAVRLQNKALPLDDARTVLFAIASAIWQCHRNGVAHRDIKPDNIMFARLHLSEAEYSQELCLIADAKEEAYHNRLRLENERREQEEEKRRAALAEAISLPTIGLMRRSSSVHSFESGGERQRHFDPLSSPLSKSDSFSPVMSTKEAPSKESILLVHQDDPHQFIHFLPKLADFGIAYLMHPTPPQPSPGAEETTDTPQSGDPPLIVDGITLGQYMHSDYLTPQGTQEFMAPEISSLLHGGSTTMTSERDLFGSDVWSLGAVLFEMVAGHLPFSEEMESLTDKSVHQQIMAADPVYLNDQTKNPIPQEVKDLISGMLCVDIRKRLTIEQVLLHPWLEVERIKERLRLERADGH